MCPCKLNAVWNESRREIHLHPFLPNQVTEKVWCCTGNVTSDVLGEGRIWGTRNDGTTVKGCSGLTFEANSQCTILVLEQNCPSGLTLRHSITVCYAVWCPLDETPVCQLLWSCFTGVQLATCLWAILTSAGLSLLRLLEGPSPKEKKTFPDNVLVEWGQLS